ncbi:MAG: cytochrome c oxidase subunit I [Proteobacteria bacterium]|nr:MAG: cytochrome c oxidase subunit I [Pseudomonadota bacterium]
MNAHAASADSGKNYLNHERGLWSWIVTYDHKRIALLYLFSIMIFFFIAGVSALILRSELARHGQQFLNSDQYNVLFTLHGAIMIFLFIVPGIPAVMGNFLIPLMIGAKDVAFPRLNLVSYYIYVIGAIMAVVGLLRPVDTGWTFYAPYSLSSNTGVILMTAAAFVLGFSSILTGLNFIVTIHKLRAPGMTWNRLPVFIWASYATAVIQTLATPVVGISLLLVYIMVLPAFGIVGEIIPVFSRKPIFGYKAVCYASVAIAVVGFVVWAHHMFVAGISDASAIYFSAATFGVAIPTAVKVFNWVSTMYKGSIRFDTPMLYAMGFVFLFMIAGTTGVYLAVLAVDVYYHDTYFVVAHFHYTIQGGAVIGLMAGLHFWFPKITGKHYNELAAKIAWVFVFFGFNLTFIPQFILGMEGMPRRYFDYPPEFEPMHFLSTVGAYFNAFGYTFALVNMAWSAFFGKVKAGRNPYESLSLEWQTESPPAHDNFPVTPVVTEWTYGYGTPIKGAAHSHA